MRRGEVFWGSPHLAGGSRKQRPFVIVSADAFNLNERYPKVMVVHLTSVRRAGGPFSWEVAVPRGVAGLTRASVAKCAEVYTLLKAQLSQRVGTLPAAYLAHIDRALSIALDLEPGSP